MKPYPLLSLNHFTLPVNRTSVSLLFHAIARQQARSAIGEPEPQEPSPKTATCNHTQWGSVNTPHCVCRHVITASWDNCRVSVRAAVPPSVSGGAMQRDSAQTRASEVTP